MFDSGFRRQDHGESPGERIGKFELVELLGEGGMGVVWLAKQDEPGLKREVALKIVKLGMDTKRVIARFEAERQALAMMDHPSIAKVFAAGIANGGRPYFVMERVDGVSITSYCDGHRLNTSSRLKLVVDLCRGVQHAHYKGIVHRDLKPSNILVAEHDESPVTKVIDFGLAKALSVELTEQTLTRDPSHVLGTLAYMSPEQAGGAADIDTRTDVYSLGAVLYELLTGELPFSPGRIEGGAFDEVLKMIREEDPIKPSACISRLNGKRATAASNRSIDARRFQKAIGGDLDAIVMMALAKDRSHRYPTPNDLAQDIERYLNGEPVEAVNKRGVYRLAKFVKRHKAAVIGSIAAMMVLIGITVMSVIQAARVEKARARTETARAGEQAGKESAEKRLGQLVETNELLGSMFDSLAPQVIVEDGRPLQTILAEKLTKALGRLDGEAIGDPLVVADIQERIGGSLKALGKSKEAISPLEQSFATRTSLLGSDHPDTLVTANTLARVYEDTGDLEAAIALYEDTLERRRAVFGEDDEKTLTSLNNLSLALGEDGQVALSLKLLEESLEANRRQMGDRHPDTLRAMNNLASGYSDSGKLELAAELYEETLRLRRRIRGSRHPETITSINNLGSVYLKMERLKEAVPLLEEALRLRRVQVERDHPDMLITMQNLGIAYMELGNHQEGLRIQEETLELKRKKLGRFHSFTLVSQSNLGAGYIEANMAEKGLPLLEEVVQINRKTRRPDHPGVTAAIGNLAMGYSRIGKYNLALPLNEECLTTLTKKFGQDHPDTLKAMKRLASSYAKTGSEARAIALFKKVIDRSTPMTDQHHLTSSTMDVLAELYLSSGDLEAGSSMFEETLVFRRVHLGEGHPDTIQVMRRLADTHGMRGSHEEAIQLLRAALEQSEEAHGKEHLSTLGSMNDLAMGLREAQRFEESVPLLEAALSGLRDLIGSDALTTLNCMKNLATAYFEDGDLERALELYRENYRGRKKLLGPSNPQTWEALAVVGYCLNVSEKWEEAIPILEEAVEVSREDPDSGFVGLHLLEAYVKVGEQKKAQAHIASLVADSRENDGENSRELATVLAVTSIHLIEFNELVDAEVHLRESLAIREEQLPDSWLRWNAQSLLGEALLGQGKLKEAEPLLLQGFEELKARKDTLPSNRPFLNEAIDRLVEFYELRGHAGDAESALRIEKERLPE